MDYTSIPEEARARDIEIGREGSVESPVDYTSILEVTRGEDRRQEGVKHNHRPGREQGDVDKMTYNVPPGHSSTTSDSLALGSWHSARANCGSDIDSSLGTLSSQGSIFSYSGDSLLGARGDRRDWSPYPSDSDFEEVRGRRQWMLYQSSMDSTESEEEQSSLRHQGAVRVPGGTQRAQPDRSRPERQGDLGGAVPWGDYSSADRHQTQSSHRSETRSLSPLARRHWTQLGLTSHRQAGHQLVL